jgi:hypothetical protein
MSLRRHGVTVTLRMTHREREELRQKARDDEITISELIRDSLYELHGIGEFPAPSSVTPPSVRRN